MVLVTLPLVLFVYALLCLQKAAALESKSTGDQTSNGSIPIDLQQSPPLTKGKSILEGSYNLRRISSKNSSLPKVDEDDQVSSKDTERTSVYTTSKLTNNNAQNIIIPTFPPMPPVTYPYYPYAQPSAPTQNINVPTVPPVTFPFAQPSAPTQNINVPTMPPVTYPYYPYAQPSAPTQNINVPTVPPVTFPFTQPSAPTQDINVPTMPPVTYPYYPYAQPSAPAENYAKPSAPTGEATSPVLFSYIWGYA